MTGVRRSAIAPISIPAQFRPALSAVAQLTPEQMEALAATLAKVGFFKSIAELEEVFAIQLGSEASDAVAALLSLAGMARTMDPAAIAAAASGAPGGQIADDLREQLQVNLQRLLESPEIYSSAAAVDLLTQHATNYQSSRIVTDMRPVFSRDVAQTPTGAVISETLQLRTWDRDGNTETLFVAMDDADLRELQEAIERALAKSETLRGLLAEQQIPVFNLDQREV